MNILKKIAGIVLIIIGALLLLINFIPGDPAIGLTIAAALFIIAGVLVMRGKKARHAAPTSEVAASEPSFEAPDAVKANPVVAEPVQAASNIVKYSFNVAGVSYHAKELEELLIENDEYDLGKMELVESGLVDERVYKYLDGIKNISLEPDPGNEYDPNAIKVVADGVLIGFVPAERTKRIRNIVEARRYALSWDILGGPYKIVREDYDEDRGREVYSLEREKMNLGVKIHIEYEK